MLHSIRVYDPEEPLNQMFVLLKADCLLHSQEGKKAWERNYQMGNEQAKLFAAAPVLKKASTEGFFRIFSKIYPIKWTQQEEGFLENGHKQKG